MKIKKTTQDKKFYPFLQFLLENVVAIFAIFYFAYIFIWHPIDDVTNLSNLKKFLDQVVTLLIAITVSDVFRSYFLQGEKNDIKELKKYFMNVPKNVCRDFDFYLRDEKFKEKLITAKEIKISGNTLNLTLHTYMKELIVAKSKGCKIEIIIADSSLETVVNSIEENFKGQTFLDPPGAVTERSIKTLKYINNETKNHGQMTIRYLPHLMNFGLIILKYVDRKSDFLLMKIYSHRKYTGTPTYLIEENNDYFEFYLNEFNNLCIYCKDYGRMEEL